MQTLKEDLYMRSVKYRKTFLWIHKFICSFCEIVVISLKSFDKSFKLATFILR